MTPPLPRLAHRLLMATLTPRYREQQLGDLHEEFVSRVERDGARGARRWYWRQVARSAFPNLIVRYRESRVPREPDRRSKSAAMEMFVQDLRYGLRSLRKHPGFAIVSSITLSLAIAVNTAIFSLVNAIVFADLPMNDPEQVATIRMANATINVTERAVSLPDYLDYAEQSESFESLAALRNRQWVLTGGEEPLRLTGGQVTANLFRTWRLPMVIGRDFLPEDARDGAPLVAIISHGFWQRHFAGSLDVLGTTLRLDGQEHTVVGVVTPQLEFADIAEDEVWVPFALDGSGEGRATRDLFVTGRLAAGVTFEQAHREIQAIGARLAEAYPASNADWEPRVLTIMEELLDDEARMILTMLVLTVVFVLLIACANVANMLLARASARSREMALRAALGAKRVRLVRQLMTESAVIALVASAIGLAGSRALMTLLVRMTNGQEDIFEMAGLDGNVLLFTLIISLTAPLAFGLVPALRSSKQDVSEALKEGSVRTAGGRSGSRLRAVLVSSQVALALMLMVVAGLLSRTVIALQQRALGFDASNVLAIEIDVPSRKYDTEERRRQYFRAVHDELGSIATVQSVAMASLRPTVQSAFGRPFEIGGRPLDPDRPAPSLQSARVSPGYFDLFGIPLFQGRDLSDQDAAQSLRVALLSREAVRRYFDGGDVLGQRIRFTDDEGAEWHVIVGVVGDIRADDDSERPPPQVYLAYAQNAGTRMVVFARTSVDPTSIAAAARQAIWRVDDEQPIDDVRSMQQVLYDEEATGYALLALFVAFAVFALCMAGVGIYGVMSYAVAQRSGEISIRMALGARATAVRGMVLWQGAKLLIGGAVVGLAGAVVLSQMLSGIVFGVSTLDPITFIGVPAILAACGLAANYLPARRATRIPPMHALRVE